MSKLLNRAMRPLTALAIVGVVGAVAAVAAFALLAMPNSKPAEAQAADVVIATTPTSVTFTIPGATVSGSDFVGFEIPGYDGALDAAPGCTVAATTATGTNLLNATEYLCINGSDGTLVGYFQTNGALAAAGFTMAITDLELNDQAGTDADITKMITLSKGTARDTATGQITTAEDDLFATATITDTDHLFYLPSTLSDTADVSSTTSNAAVQIQVVIRRLPMNMEAGSSVVLYLEDDYQVPGTIGERSLWFTVSGTPEVGTDSEADEGRHYPGDPVEVETDNYYSGGDDTAIRIYIPDMFIGDVDGTSLGFQGPRDSETLTLTVHKNAGIKNPSEAGTHSIGYAILGPNEGDVPGTPAVSLGTASTLAKISLSDDDDARGKMVTVTGSGFNDGVVAGVYMKHYGDTSATDDTPTGGRWTAPAADAAAGTRGTLSQTGDPNAGIADARAVAANDRAVRGDSGLDIGDVMTVQETCIDIIANGTQLGDGVLVGSDDRVEVEFTVANPPFRPGNKNLLCMGDGTGTRIAGGDVEHFHLDPSITVSPDTVNAGERVNIEALDYPKDQSFRWLEVRGQRVAPSSSNTTGANGKASVSFDMPGGIKGTVKVEVCFGGTTDDNCDKEESKVTVAPSKLSPSKTEVRPNESIIIRGSGFGTADGDGNDLVSAKIDEAELKVASDGGMLSNIEVSDSGQFSATFAVWASGSNNPALEAGAHTITIEDAEGYSGSIEITVLEPTISVTPEEVGPRDYVVISGTNWPVENDDGGATTDVEITISGGGIQDEEENEEADANGNWSFRYRVPGNVGIPSTLTVRAVYGASDITENGDFRIRAAELEIEPATVVPGADLTLNATGFTLYESNIEVKIGNLDVAVPTGTNTDGEGNLEDLTVTVPSLDAGVYTVQLKVGGAGGTVAIGEVTVLEDDSGGEVELPGALEPLGENLVRVFHFNNSNKTWSFYDPRPEFAELNTLSALSQGQSYWILVGETQSVTLNAKARSLTCLNGECWNQLVW